jgi:hypothetical protein
MFIFAHTNINTMKKKQVLAKYDNIINDISNKVNRINCGGCGLYAKMLGDILKENNIKFDYVMLFRQSVTNDKQLKAYIDNNDVDEVNNYHWSHVMVKIGKRYVDAEGVFDSPMFSGIRLETKKISEVFLETMLEQKSMWNPTFNRKTEKPKIKRILKKHLVE